MIWVMRSWLGAGVLLVVAGFMLAESGEGLVGVVVGWVAVGLGIVGLIVLFRPASSEVAPPAVAAMN